MQDKDTTISTFLQLFKPILCDASKNVLASLEVDKYAKKLKAIQLIILVVCAQLEQLTGLRAISGSLKDDRLSHKLGLESISYAQLSRRLRDLPPEAVQMLFQKLVLEFAKDCGYHNIGKALGRLYLIDASTVSLCLSRYLWADHANGKAGIKLHLRLVFHNGLTIPDRAIVTPAIQTDKSKMEELIVEDKDALNVFDRGYLDYKLFDCYCAEGIRFVTRLKSNAVVTVIAQRPIGPSSNIKSDQRVVLGTTYRRMQHPLRLVETEDTDGNPIRILTNDFELSTEEISDIYRYRWQIELFFKWIKQHLRVKHFYGLSRQAVENQLYIALIAYCLMLLVQIRTGFQGALLTIKRQLTTCLYDSFTSFVRKLYQRYGPVSKGRRRRPDHEAIFQETLRQVIAHGSGHLDDLTYDPIVL